MTCRKCGTQIADKAIICYKCGTATAEPVARGAAPGRSAGAKAPAYNSWLIVVIITVAVAAAVWYFKFR
jgi:hypothetical protein